MILPSSKKFLRNIIILKAIPHNDRLTALRAACLHIFRQLTQILLKIRQYSCAQFMQADVKSDCAIHMQSLYGVALKSFITASGKICQKYVTGFMRTSSGKLCAFFDI